MWGWREFMFIEKCQDMYFKWTIELDRNTPNYLVREETKRDLLKIAAGKRAVKYEKKIRSQEGSAILKECLRELDNPRKNKSPWEIDTKLYLNKNGMSIAMAHGEDKIV